MAKIEFRQKGNLSELVDRLKPMQKMMQVRMLESYAKRGLEALMSATPKRTGLTAKSWTYQIEQTDTSISINYINTNIQNGTPVAIVLDYGHYSRGHWIMGRHYIEPAIMPIFEEIANDLWGEIVKS